MTPACPPHPRDPGYGGKKRSSAGHRGGQVRQAHVIKPKAPAVMTSLVTCITTALVIEHMPPSKREYQRWEKGTGEVEGKDMGCATRYWGFNHEVVLGHSNTYLG